MSRLLVLGTAPLPYEPRQRQYAANLRTWHLTQPLLEDGHEIRLVGCQLPNTYPAGTEPVLETAEDGFEYFSVAGDRFQDPGFVQELSDDFGPDAIVGINTHPSSRAVEIETDKPIWCDLNGWVMAEAQTKTFIYDDDAYLSHFWKMEHAVLDRADVISVVSEAQAHATIGELALRGRLGRKTFGYPFVERIPNAISEVDYEHTRQVIRGAVVPEDAFVVLWAGGYNTWTDVGLLYDSLTAAMEEIPHIHFVSTGGMIEGHDEVSFNRFLEKVRACRFRDRFHFVGWVPTADVPSYYFESDLGINVDSENYETLFGARNRLNDMMKAKLPVLTTLGTEISRIVAENRLGLTAKTGDAEGFKEKVVWAARHREELRAMAGDAHAYVREHFSYARTTEALRRWARSPRRAPDLGERVRFEDIDFFRQDRAEAGRSPAASPRGEEARVLAVIVHHRGRAMLERCLRSLLGALGVDLEIVLVLNHCQEELPGIVDSPNVHRVVSDVSLGFSAANNLGVDWAGKHLAEADYYYFVNNDTESFPDSLGHLVAQLESRPAAAMAGPKLLILGAPDHYNSLGINVTEDGWGWDEGIGQRVEDYGPVPPTRDVLAVTGSALLLDARVFHQIRGWTEAYGYYFEDIDLAIKVWKNGHEVVHVPDAVVLHAISATMTEGSERKIFFFWRNRLLLALIHWPLWLLAKTLKRAVFDEILDRRRNDRPLLRKAMRQAIGMLPSLLVLRWRFRGDTGWRRFLVPPGSVPVITLPEVDAKPPALETESAGVLSTAAPPAVEEGGSKLMKARRELAEAESRLYEAEVQRRTLQGELDQVHGSKMWRFWMLTIAVRRRLARPFAFLKPSS